MLIIGLPVKGAITMKKKHIISEETLTHTVPCRQKQAKEYLQGRSPGVMRSYAPDAHADDKVTSAISPISGLAGIISTL